MSMSFNILHIDGKDGVYNVLGCEIGWLYISVYLFKKSE